MTCLFPTKVYTLLKPKIYLTFKFLQIPSILGSGFLFPSKTFNGFFYRGMFLEAKALQVAKAAARDIAEAMAQRKAWSFVFSFGEDGFGRWRYFACFFSIL